MEFNTKKRKKVREMEQKEKVIVHVDATQVEQMIEKANELNILLEKANSLVDELASKNILLDIDLQN